jgi:hypothetical protein
MCSPLSFPNACPSSFRHFSCDSWPAMIPRSKALELVAEVQMPPRAQFGPFRNCSASPRNRFWQTPFRRVYWKNFYTTTKWLMAFRRLPWFTAKHLGLMNFKPFSTSWFPSHRRNSSSSDSGRLLSSHSLWNRPPSSRNLIEKKENDGTPNSLKHCCNSIMTTQRKCVPMLR